MAERERDEQQGVDGSGSDDDVFARAIEATRSSRVQGDLFAQQRFAERRWGNRMSVSYTHLDVYKRQVHTGIFSHLHIRKLIANKN